jgi:translation initiation factor IF-1
MMGRPDYAQQMLPGLDLSWLSECANVLLDCDDEIEHMAKLAGNDDLSELKTALDDIHQKMIEAGRIAVALCRKHKVNGHIVGDTRRDGQRQMAKMSETESPETPARIIPQNYSEGRL